MKLTLSLMFAALMSASAMAQTVGEIAEVENAAWRTPPDAARMEARSLDPVVRDEALETGAASGLMASFADGSAVYAKPIQWVRVGTKRFVVRCAPRVRVSPYKVGQLKSTQP